MLKSDFRLNLSASFVALQVGILFALMAIGYGCRRFKILSDDAIRGIVNILVVVVTPAIVVQAFQRPFDPAMLRGLGFMSIAALAGHGLAILATLALIHHRNAPTKNVLRVSAVFSNAGFMGIPLTYSLFGEEGVFYSVVYVAVFNVVVWSWGICTVRNVSMKAMTRSDVKQMFINPGTIGLALGLPLFFTSTTLPLVISAPVKALSDLNTPLAMIVIGYYLAGAKFAPIFKMRSAYISGAFRLLAYPLLVIGALALLRGAFALDRTMMLTLVVSSAAPTAALPAMFAARYMSDVDTAVGLVSATTLVSIFTMPPVIAFAMTVLG